VVIICIVVIGGIVEPFFSSSLDNKYLLMYPLNGCNTDPTKKTGGERSCSRRKSSSCLL